MERVYNFSAGPSMIDLSVLQKAAEQMTCYGDKGMSVLEMSNARRCSWTFTTRRFPFSKS
jgi:phosphoserine aminotransferase